MKNFEDYLSEKIKTDEFREAYDDVKPEIEAMVSLVRAREASKMTQKQLAKATGINQADISKIENGTRNPSLKLLKRLADGMNMDLEIKFVPKKKIM